MLAKGFGVRLWSRSYLAEPFHLANHLLMHADETDWLINCFAQADKNLQLQSILGSLCDIVQSATQSTCRYQPAIREETQAASSSRLFDQTMPATFVLLALMQTPPLLRPDYFPGLGARNPYMHHIPSPDTLLLHTRVWTLPTS